MCFGGILLPRGVNSVRLIFSKILKLAVAGRTSASELCFWLVTVEPNCDLVLPGRGRTCKLGPKRFFLCSRKIALMGSVDKFLTDRLTYLSIAINVTMYHAIAAFARTPE